MTNRPPTTSTRTNEPDVLESLADALEARQPGARGEEYAFDLGVELKAARKAAGLSQDDVAARLGIDRSRVARLEANMSVASFGRVCAYADAIGYRLSSAPAKRGGRRSPRSSPEDPKSAA